MHLKITWCLLMAGCWCVTLANHNIQTLQRPRRATAEDLDSASGQLDSASAAISALSDIGSAFPIFGSILSVVSFIVKIAAGTQEDAESRLMKKFSLVLKEIDNLKADTTEIKNILEWSYYKEEYAGYIRTIEVLFEDTTKFLENPQDIVLKNEIKSQTASDTSVDEFFNFVTRSYLIQEDTFFEAAFKYFKYDMRKTQALMKDCIGWLIQGMVVQEVAPVASGFSGSALDSHLDRLTSTWQVRMNTTWGVMHDLQEHAKWNAIDYITEDTNMFFERYPDKSSDPISDLRGVLEEELNTKYFYTKTSVVGLEDEHQSSCVYAHKPQYTCDGTKDRNTVCPEGRNFAIFTYPPQYERSPKAYFLDVHNDVESTAHVLFDSSFDERRGSQEYIEFIANSTFKNFTRIVIDKNRVYALPTSNCFIETEQELKVVHEVGPGYYLPVTGGSVYVPSSGKGKNDTQVYKFTVLVDVCSPVNDYITSTQNCNRSRGSFVQVKTLSALLYTLVLVVLYVV